MKSRQSEIRAVLFDVGGVLVELSGLAMLMSWLQNRVSAEQVYAIWLTSPTVRSFEAGKMQPEMFAEQLIVELGLPLGKAQFLAEFSTWGQRVLPGALELVKSVPGKYLRATLSNTNVLHWQGLIEQQELLGTFDRHFASHLTGKVKPDEEAFQYVVAALGCEAHEILFLDDSVLNVAGAKKVGIRAFEARGPVEAGQTLRAAGVLSP